MDYTEAQTARASAVLTTGEVAANTFKLERAQDSQVTCNCAFTVGSLTNVILRGYASVDGSTWDLVYNPDGSNMTVTLTASDTIGIASPRLDGYKYFRLTAQGTGTVTSSLLAITYRYLTRGSQR